jgi:hypothetical protein
MRSAQIVLALLLTASAFGQSKPATSKAAQKEQKATSNAVASASALRSSWLPRGSGFNLRKAYLLVDGRTCFVFDIGFAPMTALASPRTILQGGAIIQSEDGAGAAKFIDEACTRDGQLRPGKDITQAVLQAMPAPSRLADVK